MARYAISLVGARHARDNSLGLSAVACRGHGLYTLAAAGDVCFRTREKTLDSRKAAHGDTAVPGQGSAGNVISALASLFIPGLGQLLQGRLLAAIVQFVLAAVLWVFLLGWIVHLYSILNAAMFKPEG